MMICFPAADRGMAMSRPAAILIFMLFVTVAGCGGPTEDLPATVPVTGTVIYDGKPVKNATVMFHPEDPTAGNPAVARTKDDGSYTMTTYEFGDGAILGKHAVTVELFNAPITLPPKYGSSESTPLEYTVESGPNHFDIMLVE